MARKKAGSAQLSAVAKRFGVTAREARDIATAVANAASVTARNITIRDAKVPVKRLAKDVARQVKETGRAAVTGKSGKTALKTFENVNKAKPRYYGITEGRRKMVDVPMGLKKGKKRK